MLVMQRNQRPSVGGSLRSKNVPRDATIARPLVGQGSPNSMIPQQRRPSSSLSTMAVSPPASPRTLHAAAAVNVDEELHSSSQSQNSTSQRDDEDYKDDNDEARAGGPSSVSVSHSSQLSPQFGAAKAVRRDSHFQPNRRRPSSPSRSAMQPSTLVSSPPLDPRNVDAAATAEMRTTTTTVTRQLLSPHSPSAPLPHQQRLISASLAKVEDATSDELSQPALANATALDAATASAPAVATAAARGTNYATTSFHEPAITHTRTQTHSRTRSLRTPQISNDESTSAASGQPSSSSSNDGGSVDNSSSRNSTPSNSKNNINISTRARAPSLSSLHAPMNVDQDSLSANRRTTGARTAPNIGHRRPSDLTLASSGKQKQEQEKGQLIEYHNAYSINNADDNDGSTTTDDESDRKRAKFARSSASTPTARLRSSASLRNYNNNSIHITAPTSSGSSSYSAPAAALSDTARRRASALASPSRVSPLPLAPAAAAAAAPSHSVLSSSSSPSPKHHHARRRSQSHSVVSETHIASAASSRQSDHLSVASTFSAQDVDHRSLPSLRSLALDEKTIAGDGSKASKASSGSYGEARMRMSDPISTSSTSSSPASSVRRTQSPLPPLSEHIAATTTSTTSTSERERQQGQRHQHLRRSSAGRSQSESSGLSGDKISHNSTQRQLQQLQQQGQEQQHRQQSQSSLAMSESHHDSAKSATPISSDAYSQSIHPTKSSAAGAATPSTPKPSFSQAPTNELLPLFTTTTTATTTGTGTTTAESKSINTDNPSTSGRAGGGDDELSSSGAGNGRGYDGSAAADKLEGLPDQQPLTMRRPSMPIISLSESASGSPSRQVVGATPSSSFSATPARPFSTFAGPQLATPAVASRPKSRASVVGHTSQTPTAIVSLTNDDHNHLEMIHDAARNLASMVVRIGRGGIVPPMQEWDSINASIHTMMQQFDALQVRWTPVRPRSYSSSYRTQVQMVTGRSSGGGGTPTGGMTRVESERDAQASTSRIVSPTNVMFQPAARPSGVAATAPPFAHGHEHSHSLSHGGGAVHRSVSATSLPFESVSSSSVAYPPPPPSSHQHLMTSSPPYRTPMRHASVSGGSAAWDGDSSMSVIGPDAEVDVGAVSGAATGTAMRTSTAGSHRESFAFPVARRMSMSTVAPSSSGFHHAGSPSGEQHSSDWRSSRYVEDLTMQEGGEPVRPSNWQHQQPQQQPQHQRQRGYATTEYAQDVPMSSADLASTSQGGMNVRSGFVGERYRSRPDVTHRHAPPPPPPPVHHSPTSHVMQTQHIHGGGGGGGASLYNAASPAHMVVTGRAASSGTGSSGMSVVKSGDHGGTHRAADQIVRYTSVPGPPPMRDHERNAPAFHSSMPSYAAQHHHQHQQQHHHHHHQHHHQQHSSHGGYSTSSSFGAPHYGQQSYASLVPAYGAGTGGDGSGYPSEESMRSNSGMAVGYVDDGGGGGSGSGGVGIPRYGIAGGSGSSTAAGGGGGGGGGGGVLSRPTKYRKRSRAPGPGQCISCAASDTPEWRRGPNGARTLCNACGLHYSKLVRRKRAEEQDESAVVSIEELRASLKIPP